MIDAADSAVPDTPVFGCGLDFRFAERRVADRVATGAHHYILEHGRALHRIWLRGDPERAVLAAIIPLDGMTGTRLEAVQELDRSLRGVPTPQPGVWPTLYQAQRLDLLLAILDLREGTRVTSHEVASRLVYPRMTIGRGAAWKASPERRRTQRLIREAEAIAARGYRALLAGTLGRQK
ncbi:MAG: DNA -binding domain-containing protein [Sphingopyxis sp.]